MIIYHNMIMGKILSILIFCIIIFYGGNALLYIFNVTNFLFGYEFVLSDDLLINYLYLILLSFFILGILLLINNRLFPHLNRPYHYFVLSLFYCVIFFIFTKIINENEKFSDINNVLSMILVIFLTTYSFYYSIYYSTLIEYKRNN